MELENKMVRCMLHIQYCYIISRWSLDKWMSNCHCQVTVRRTTFTACGVSSKLDIPSRKVKIYWNGLYLELGSLTFNILISFYSLGMGVFKLSLEFFIMLCNEIFLPLHDHCPDKQSPRWVDCRSFASYLVLTCLLFLLVCWVHYQKFRITTWWEHSELTKYSALLFLLYIVWNTTFINCYSLL
mgnify:CR=1 FL=1